MLIAFFFFGEREAERDNKPSLLMGQHASPVSSDVLQCNMNKKAFE